jgi:hypothetical protein
MSRAIPARRKTGRRIIPPSTHDLRMGTPEGYLAVDQEDVE